jgi:hypothetical protein
MTLRGSVLKLKVSSNNTNKDSLSVQTVQKREINTRQPANPPARFAFRHTRNSRATADRAQSPNKQPHTKSHIGREIKKTVYAIAKTCNIAK